MLALLLLLADLVAPPVEHPFEVKVVAEYHVYGYDDVYYLGRDDLFVVVKPYRQPSRERFHHHFTPGEKRDWARFLDAFPVKKLKERYGEGDTPLVLRFEFRHPPKKVSRTTDVEQPDLDRLIRALNDAVPPGLEIQTPIAPNGTHF